MNWMKTMAKAYGALPRLVSEEPGRLIYSLPALRRLDAANLALARDLCEEWRGKMPGLEQVEWNTENGLMTFIFHEPATAALLSRRVDEFFSMALDEAPAINKLHGEERRHAVRERLQTYIRSL